MLSRDGPYLQEASFLQPQAKETLTATALAEYLVVLGQSLFGFYRGGRKNILCLGSCPIGEPGAVTHSAARAQLLT